MTVKYLRKDELDRPAHWISVGNLRIILLRFPDSFGVESNDLSDLVISADNDHIGYIALKDGEGEFITFKSIMESLDGI